MQGSPSAAYCKFGEVAQLAHGLCCVLSRTLCIQVPSRAATAGTLLASAGYEYPQRVVPGLVRLAGEGVHFCRDRTFGQSPPRVAVKIGSGQLR